MDATDTTAPPGEACGDVWRVAKVAVSFGRDSYLAAHEACHANAKLWMLTVEWLHAQWRQGSSPSKRDLQDFVVSLPSNLRPVHAHTAQIVAHDLHEAVKTFRENRAQGRKNARAPWRTKNYRPLSFTAGYGWRVHDRTLYLSLGRGRPRLAVKLPVMRDSTTGRFVPHSDWGEIQLCWDIDARRFSLHIPYRSQRPAPTVSGGLIAIDEGIINSMTLARQAEDGSYKITVINGREGRAIKRRRNKANAAINQRLSKTKPGSRRHRKLTLARKRNQARCQARLQDFDHQVARKAANVVAAAGADRVVVGDVRGIEQKTRRKQRRSSRSLRQQLSQWSRGRQERYLAEKTGLELEHLDEAYTSQTCLACGARNRPRGRNSVPRVWFLVSPRRRRSDQHPPPSCPRRPHRHRPGHPDPGHVSASRPALVARPAREASAQYRCEPSPTPGWCDCGPTAHSQARHPAVRGEPRPDGRGPMRPARAQDQEAPPFRAGRFTPQLPPHASWPRGCGAPRTGLPSAGWQIAVLAPGSHAPNS